MSKERSARAKTQVPELLAPAGGPAAFYAALAAGADAIYCGLGSRFNARRGAGNFEDADFAEACRTAHLAGARVYVTENVVIKTDEVPAALALVKRAWDLGADAVMVNTAIAASGDPVAMAGAFRAAQEAGRAGYEAGLAGRNETAVPTSPMEAFLKEAMK